MEDYTTLKSLALQKKILLNMTASEVIAHEEHIEKTKKVFVKLFLGEDTNDGGGGSDPESQEANDPVIPDPIPEPTIPWEDGVEGLYPVAVAPTATPEGYVRFADSANRYVIFLKHEDKNPILWNNIPEGVVLPSVSLINSMHNYGIKNIEVGSHFQDGTPASSVVWPAEQTVYHWTKDCLAAMKLGAANGVPSVISGTVWGLYWTKETGLTSKIVDGGTSAPYSGMAYFSLYTGV